jgi:mono/diheme cytochrome c family protein
MGQVYMPVAMTMSWCIDCHRHPENHLRPADRITDMEWAPARQRELGLAIMAERRIAPPTHCSGCHR